MKTHNPKQSLFVGFFITLILSLVVYGVFGFEISVIFAISLSVGWILAGVVGLENTLIRLSDKEIE